MPSRSTTSGSTAVRIFRIDNWDGAPGGAQDYIREVTAELAARGHVTRIIQVTDGAAAIPPPDGLKVPTARGRSARFRADVFVDRTYQGLLEREIRDFAPDLISLHHFDARFATVARVLAAQRVPIVMANHDAELVCPISTLVQPGNVVCDGGVRVRCLFTGCRVGWGGPYNLLQTRSFDMWLRDRVRAYLCPSRSLTDYLDANGYRPAVHLPSFARIPDTVRVAALPWPASTEPPTIGYLGRLEWYKGVHDLLRAVALVRRAVPDVRLDIAGTGPSRAELESLAGSLGIGDRVTFRGQVSGPAKDDWFRAIHVVAVPSNMWENFPLVALEALTRGRPVVATRIGGIPDIVDDGTSGHLVPIGDPPAMADRLSALLQDPDGARRMGQAGRTRTLARFTPETHVARLLAVYDAVLAGRALPSRSAAADLVPTGPVDRSGTR